MPRRIEPGHDISGPRNPRSRAGATAASHATGPVSRLARDHARALDTTLDQLREHIIGTLLTLCVIGIVLALPAALASLLHDAASSTYHLGQESAQATLFLKNSVSPAAGEALAARIARTPGVSASRYVSRDAALAEFKAHAGAGDALALLGENPLPASIIVTPDVHAEQATTRALLKSFAALPEVDQAQLNQDWLQKLYAILNLANRILTMIMAALAVTVLIVIANTVRLEIEDRRDEIAVMKLFGASNAYVRRPFLYSGVCYGLGGAIVAWVLVNIGIAILQHAVQRVATLYGGSVSLSGLDFDASAALLGISVSLGWLAAFWTASRHFHHG